MTPKIEKTSELGYKLTLAIPVDQINESVEAKATELSKDAVLKGFRKGKAPMRVVLQRFGQQIRGEELNRLVQERFKSTLEDESLEPVWYSNARLNEKPVDSPDSDVEAEVLLEVAPTVSLDYLEGIAVKRPSVIISDEDIEQQIQQFLHRFKEWSPVQRPAQIGDRIVVSYAARTEGNSSPNSEVQQDLTPPDSTGVEEDEPTSIEDRSEDDGDLHEHAHDHSGNDDHVHDQGDHEHDETQGSSFELVIGDIGLSRRNRKICEAVIGKLAGESVDVDFSDSQNSNEDPESESNAVTQEIAVESVSSAPAMEVTDEICREHGLPYEGATDMRDSFQTEIDKHVAEQQKNLVHRQLYDAASKRCTLVLPNCHFREALLRKVSDFYRNTGIDLSRQAIRILNLDTDEEPIASDESDAGPSPMDGIIQSMWDRTLQENAWIFVLRALVEKHGIEPDSETVSQRINEALSSLHTNPDPELEDQLLSEQNYRSMLNQTVVEQAFDEMEKVSTIENVECSLDELLSGHFEESLDSTDSSVTVDERTDKEWYRTVESSQDASPTDGDQGSNEVAIQSDQDSTDAEFQPAEKKPSRWRLPWLRSKT